MLYIVLVLVLAALGLLVAALITANSLWAWISIGLSVVAGLLLVFDLLRRRKKRAVAPAEETADGEADEEPEADEPDEADDKQTVLMPAAGELGDADEAPEPQRNGDPGEEESDPADVVVVSELEVEVVVVDEYPRYHVTTCAWLETRATIPLGIGEARQLGFTPCALCTPDAEIAGEHRDKTKADS
ncbi:hypothetical protein BS329_29120 [Amycolatopsis coloradensis]|uniref:Uncharacterized protein n=1 Tax=Amycolatopsis coloradensis TaxID=76021 RepID=A0A1R0KKL4_9PSEU|nr:hypothetical protein [Amycolatopsis coloradensis]OLZ46872.1 hypothetical protein BS329_29120 [Amycolatopsis coloradensis]